MVVQLGSITVLKDQHIKVGSRVTIGKSKKEWKVTDIYRQIKAEQIGSVLSY